MFSSFWSMTNNNNISFAMYKYFLVFGTCKYNQYYLD